MGKKKGKGARLWRELHEHTHGPGQAEREISSPFGRISKDSPILGKLAKLALIRWEWPVDAEAARRKLRAAPLKILAEKSES